MSYIRYKSVNFGAFYSGLATVGYTLRNPDNTVNTGRTTAGVVEQGPHPTGIYGALVTLPSGFSGFLYWDTAAGSSVYASEEIQPGTDEYADVATSTRLPTSGYTAPDNADIVLIKAQTDALPEDPASNTEVATRLAASAYTVPPTAAAVAAATWADGAAYADGTKGADLVALAAEADPWATHLPGAYVAPQAGYLIGQRLDVAVSTRAIAGSITQTAPIGASGLLVIHVGADYGPTPAGLQRFLWLADSGVQPDATGGTFEVAVGGLAGSPFAGAIVIASPSGPQLFEGLFTHVQTAGWVTGTYHFRAVLLVGGIRSIVAEGLLEVRPGL